MERAVPRSRWVCWLPFIFVALLGLAVRLPQLGVRPMHTDEAINAYIVGQLLSGDPFTYDPQDRHGPALSALALPLARMQGARSFSDLTESELRFTSVVAGTITVLLFGAGVELFGFLPCLIAALLFAFAPLPVYYDRYFIHESLFCAATFGLILSGWRASKTNSVRDSVLVGACAALMLGSKETAVIHFCALAVAALVLKITKMHRSVSTTRIRPRTLLISCGTFLLFSVAAFTWFGRNWKALPALLQAIPDFFSRAAGQGHEKPFWYFAHLLTGGWSGALIVALGCVGVVVATKKTDSWSYRYLAIYFIFIAASYSLIPYKTPWLALNLWLPLALFAGCAVDFVWKTAIAHLPMQSAIPVFGILAAMVASLLAHDIRQRVFVFPADENNPFAYAHTTDDILDFR